MRKAVRDKIVDMLSVITGVDVYSQRYTSYKTLPAINVRVGDGDGNYSPAENMITRNLKVMVEIYTAGDQNSERLESDQESAADQVDRLIKSVEAILTTDRQNLDGLTDGGDTFYRLRYLSEDLKEKPSVDQTEEIYLRATLHYEGVYHKTLS